MIRTPYRLDSVGALSGSFWSKPISNADRLAVFDGDRPDRVDRVEKTGLLHQENGALVAEGQTGADRDAFVFLAQPDQGEVLVFRQRPEQSGACGDVRVGPRRG